MSKTIAILTGGGDCPGLNAVIRGVTRTAVREHGWTVIAQERYGRMVSLQGRRVVDVEIAQAVSQLNHVDPQGELVTTAEALGITLGR